MNRVSSLGVFCGLVFVAFASPNAASSFVVHSPQAAFVVNDSAPNQEVLRVFAGTIVMQSGMFFLRTNANVLYALDNQALAAKFADKKVEVSGTLDKKATIHVENIEEQKA